MSKHKSGTPHTLPLRLQEDLEKSKKLVASGDWQEAEKVLESLNRHYPRRVEILELLRAVYKVRSVYRWPEIAEQLLSLQADNPNLITEFATRMQRDGFPGFALHWWRYLTESYPHRATQEAVHKQIAAAESAIDGTICQLRTHLEITNLNRSEIEELVSYHEEARLRSGQDRFEQAIRLERRVLEAAPQWTPALLQMAWAEWGAEKIEAALKTINLAHQLYPDDIEVLSLAVCLYYLSGNREPAQKLSEILRPLLPKTKEQANRKADAFSIIGDYEAVLAILEEASDADVLPENGENPAVWQLAGEAAYRLDRFEEARAFWEVAIEISTEQLAGAMAKSNLKEWDKPTTKEAAIAFPYYVFRLMDRCIFQEFLESLGKMARTRDFEGMARDAQVMVRRHPALVTVVPFYLHRGCELMRIMAISIATDVRTPPFFEALRSFGFSRDGSDKERFNALQRVAEAGYIPAGMAKMWWRGQWQEMPLVHAPGHRDLPRRLSPAIERELSAIQKMRDDGKGEEAIKRMQTLCDNERKTPELHKKLAIMQREAGQIEKAIGQLRCAVELYPDYVAARLLLGELHLENGDYEAAHQVLEPLITLPRVRFKEFPVWWALKARIAIAQNNFAAARPWLDCWQHFDDKNEEMIELRRQANLSVPEVGADS